MRVDICGRSAGDPTQSFTRGRAAPKSGRMFRRYAGSDAPIPGRHPCRPKDDLSDHQVTTNIQLKNLQVGRPVRSLRAMCSKFFSTSMTGMHLARQAVHPSYRAAQERRSQNSNRHRY